MSNFVYLFVYNSEAIAKFVKIFVCDLNKIDAASTKKVLRTGKGKNDWVALK